MSTSATPAFVLWFGPTGLAIARSLGRRGVPVIALHHDSNEPSTGSRYADVHIVRPVEEDEEGWLRLLLEEGRRLRGARAPLLVASDATWLFAVRNRQALSQYFAIPLPEVDDATEWMNKTWQYAAAARAGIPFPRIMTPYTPAELREAAGSVAYPCVLKPALSHLWRKRYPQKLAFARTREELLAFGDDAMSAGLAFAVQEFIPADDSDVYGVFSYVGHSGQSGGHCTIRKVRQFEPRFGSSCCSESVDEPRVLELGLRLVKSIGFRGISSVEFKRDKRDGDFKLMEINLRSPLLMGAVIDSGLDLPYIAYRDLIGDPLPLQKPTRLGRRAGIFAQDIFSARYYRQLGKLSLARWLWGWLRTRDLHFAWDDLAPFRGYMHTLFDHYRRGKYRDLPANFPTAEEWALGEWPCPTATEGPRAARQAPSKMSVSGVA